MGTTPEQIAAMKSNEKATQFGQPGGNKRPQENQEANKPWSIHNQLRRLGAAKVKAGDKEALQKLLPAEPTLAQLTAMNVWVKASKADMRAVEFVTERIDGKIMQVNVNADLERVQAMSDEELELYNADVVAQIKSLRAAAAGTDIESGDPEQGDSEGTSTQAAADVEPVAGSAADGAGEQG